MPEYEFNVGRFLADFPHYCVQIGSEGFGYIAQKRDEYGHGVGERYSALTFDELAAMLAKAGADA